MQQYEPKPVEVINNLTTNNSDKALSAAQGKALNESKVNFVTTSYSNTTLVNIANDLVSKYGSNYYTEFVAYDLTDGNPGGMYIAIKNSNFSSKTRFLHYDGSLSSGSNYTLDSVSLVGASSVTDMTSTFGATEGNIKLIRWGKVRILSFDGARAPAATGYFTFDSFASGDRPAYYTHGILDRSDNHTAWNLWVRPSGTIGQSNYTASATASGSIIWIVP